MTDTDRRAEEAHRLLTNEMFREAFATLEASIVARLAVPSASDKVQEAHYELVMLHRIRRHLEQVIMTGKMDAMATQRKVKK